MAVVRRGWVRRSKLKHNLFSFESRHQPLASRRRFLKRLGKSLAAASLLIGGSLLIGMLGYRFFEGMEWIDAFANAAMILSGMGPLGPLQSWGGKLFAGLYALYSGLALILATGVIFAPMMHRVLHRIHVEEKEE
jgi:hypothetical protein